MNVDSEVVKKTLMFTLNGDFDECGYKDIKDIVDSRIEGLEYVRVVFDFGGVGFMDSTGIGMLISKYKQLSNMGKPCYIANLKKPVEKILKMTGIFSIIPKIDINDIKEDSRL